MLHTFARLYRFNAQANRDALEALRALPAAPTRALELIAHIGESELHWLDRLEGTARQPAGVWPVRTLEESAALLERAELRWRAYMDATRPDALTRPVRYRDSQGREHTSNRIDILLHVALHSQEHRGQIGDLVGAGGGAWREPEYIWWLREGRDPGPAL